MVLNKRGEQFETLAADWLAARGATILERNFQCKVGEIDLIALDGNCLVFVEVRARSPSRFSSAAASVDRRKQQRIIRTAQWYLQSRRRWSNTPCRFDVIAIEPRQLPDNTAVRWIRSAFTQ